MKNKIIFPIILSAVLLAACNSESTSSPAENPTESEVTTALETEPTETETVSETTETAAETAEEKIEDISGSTSSDHFDYFTFDFGKFEVNMEDYPFALIKPDTHRECKLLSKNLLCAIYQYQELDQDRLHYLRIYDIDQNEIAAEILMPDGNNFLAYGCENNDENVLIQVYMSSYRDDTVHYSEMTVYKDYSYDIIDDDSTPYPGIDYCNTGIYGNEPGAEDIVNLRTNTTLVEDGDNGIALFGASIDENRFSFIKREYGVGTYIGIYDYSTGGITEIPDSDILGVIGYYNGKIYAYNTNTAELKMEQCVGEIYSFDVETLEKNILMTFHTPDDGREGSIDCFMEQNCGYMAVALEYNIGKETAYIVSLDSGEIVAKHDSGDDWDDYDGKIRGITYADGRIALQNFSTDKLLVFDPKE